MRSYLFTAVMMLLLIFFSVSGATEIRLSGMETTVNVTLPGEPYQLLGNRIVFTNWFYVRPGFGQWHDSDGKPLSWQDFDPARDPNTITFKEVNDIPTGIELLAQPAQHLGPVITPQHPWEQNGIGFATVIQDGDIFKAWCLCVSAEKKRFMAYYTSTDGINWQRPDLGIIEYQGSKKNNLTSLDPEDRGDAFWGWGVYKDPSATPAERYKATKAAKISLEAFADYLKRFPDFDPRADRVGAWHVVLGAVSPDGLNWTILPDPISVEHSDTQPVLYYDQQIKKYVMYTRQQMVGNFAENAPGKWQTLGSWATPSRRSIGRTVSDTFHHFQPSELIITPGPQLPPSDCYYNNSRTSIPSAPDHHLMFPAVYHLNDDTTTIVLASSCDGKIWQFLPGPPVLDTPEFGPWNGGCIFTHPDLIELPNGSFALPYTGHKFPHKFPRGQFPFLPGYAVWPKGRIVALQAAAHGSFATIAFMPPGKKLLINATTKRAGSILVEVVQLAGQTPIPGHSFADSIAITGDQHWQPVTWRQSDELGYEPGSAIFLRFKMDQAKIFGLQFD